MGIVFCDVRTDVSRIFLVNIDLSGLVRLCFVVYNEHHVSENFSHFSAPWLTKHAHTIEEFVTARNNYLIMTMMT
jgi:hypothetical protein